MNFKRKLLIILISFITIIPLNTFAYSKYLIPGGENIGIKVESDGVYVVGFYKVDGKEIAKEAGLLVGDRIISINDEKIDSVSMLLDKIDSTKNAINIKIGFIRNNKVKDVILKLKKDKNNTYKTGIYVKDSITGIGTLTYINPSDNSYGALGHEVNLSDMDTNFVISSGKIFASKITSLERATVGHPGEKNAKLELSKAYGNIKLNLKTGIYGKLDKKISDDDPLPVASIDEVEIGKAEIITVLNDNKKEHFDVLILSIDKNNSTKNFLIKIVDEKLLKECGGVIKGMSGSPIIQNGKIVGAITHTIVDNPEKGYGISIIKMLESVE